MSYNQSRHTELSIRKSTGQLSKDEEEELEELKEKKKEQELEAVLKKKNK